MPTGYFSNPLVFVVQTLFQLYILCVLLRFMLQQVRADFYNPVSQFLVKATQPVLRPLRKVIPGYGGIDWAAVVLIVVLQALAVEVVALIRGGLLMPGLLAVTVLYQLVELVLNVYLFGILIMALLSWVQAGYNPVAALLHDLTDPVLRPFRRLIPPMGGFDLSPLVAILAIQVAKMLILPPIAALARFV